MQSEEKLSKLGFIAGPDETEEAFLRRVECCLNQPEIPRSQESAPLLNEAAHFTAEFADFSPTWVPLFLSKEKLLPWHGGVATIYQMEIGSPRAAFLQIRPNGALFHSPFEIAKHELVHIARMQFDEPRFEEMLAYMTASGRFTRFFGPLFRSPLFVNLFILSLILLLFIDALLLIFTPDLYLSLLPLKLIPLGMVLFAFFKLLIDRRTLSKTLKNLKEITGDTKKAQAILFRLTDREIIRFSKMDPKDLLEEAKRESSIRWRQIYPYFLR